MNAAIDTADLAFREMRRTWIGGSDIAALLGCAPPTWRRNTPLALYLDKVTPPAPDEDRGGFKRRGKRWESVVAEMLIEKLTDLGHTVEVVKNNERYTDPEHPFFRAEIDMEIKLDGEEEITNVELKTVHPFRVGEWGEEDTDAAPVWYTAQAQWGLGVTRRQRCIIAPLFGADELRVYPVDAAEDVIAGIRAAALNFWVNHIVPRVPPPPTNLMDLAALYPKDTVPTIELGTHQGVLDALAELREIKERMKSLEAREEAAKVIIQHAMGAHGIATVGGQKACSWKTQQQKRLDEKRLKEERPEIVEAYMKIIEFRRFTVSSNKR